MKNQRRIGRQHEEAAASFLQSQGCTVIEQNYYCHFGEIDLIAEDGDALAFIEVKYRKNAACGFAAEAVSRKKQLSIIRCAKMYMLQKGRSFDRPVRFDVIAIDGEEITWIKDAFF